MPKPLVVGNWKMHKTVSEATTVVRRFLEIAPNTDKVEVVFAPPFPALPIVGSLIADTPFFLAAQNLFWEEEGAYTGEISALMLQDLGCKYVIVGHSERRRVFREGNKEVNKKVHAALRHKLHPIMCIGESLEEREKGQTMAVVKEQTLKSLQGLSLEDIRRVTLAYEPVWAIGTGHSATVSQAEEVHRFLRTTLETQWGSDTRSVRILYGGSVSAKNSGEFLRSPEINGALVGKACLDPESFGKIANSAPHEGL